MAHFRYKRKDGHMSNLEHVNLCMSFRRRLRSVANV